eukprot:Lithocolla_globosa_v1_NODE_308_length_4571_cov_13.445306.p3 type:complete len:140 gc:universal NODE_308_length_4571_cov_13.445306:4076-4495(+)
MVRIWRVPSINIWLYHPKSAKSTTNSTEGGQEDILLLSNSQTQKKRGHFYIQAQPKLCREQKLSPQSIQRNKNHQRVTITQKSVLKNIDRSPGSPQNNMVMYHRQMNLITKQLNGEKDVENVNTEQKNNQMKIMMTSPL